MKGVKHDKGKPRVELIDPEALLEEGHVMAFGAEKYGDYNWARGMAWSRLIGAALRHTLAFSRGESLDPESGRSHLAHLRCCAGMLFSYEKNGLGCDDRIGKAVKRGKTKRTRQVTQSARKRARRSKDVKRHRRPVQRRKRR